MIISLALLLSIIICSIILFVIMAAGSPYPAPHPQPLTIDDNRIFLKVILLLTCVLIITMFSVMGLNYVVFNTCVSVFQPFTYQYFLKLLCFSIPL